MTLRTTLTLLLLLLSVGTGQTAPAPAPDFTPTAEEQAQAEDYLSQFYADVGTKNMTSRRITVASFQKNLETMQAFFGLEVTGKLDSSALEVMKKPRCGVSDISRYGHFFGKPKWEKTVITYRVTQYTNDLSRSEVDATLAKAFKLYSDVTPLQFEQIHSGTADIVIFFKGGDHGDFYPFDGPNGVLAHANSPGLNQGGDTHFDEDELWTLSQRGVNLLLVAAHEFGHALGLDHSRDRKALMYPTYQYVDTEGYKLPEDDRLGIQDLYAKDVAFFFEGNQYWGIKGYRILPGYPKHISSLGFPSWVTKIDAAVYVATTRRTLFFVRNQYWSFDETRGQMDYGYPRYITYDFPGIGSKVDAAFENYGYLYFSDGAQQSEYHYGARRVTRVLLNYGWLDCY
ncbi:hypothetical protein MATL_G00115270 [Megalops atlanticus]|uniref:Peptidase metallopeptidase domain-containing protein n=1 Tax=Megalops atlanticus TaxID=7932 RepID=A0A9D3PYT2_MEGAT|nr:hypothetical protein MATL_G00115270 [Megalops atlanticus]